MQLGFEIVDDSSQAHYVVVFPQVTEANEAYFAEPQDDAEGWWTAIFRDESLAPNPGKLGKMTRKEFHEAVREALVDILQGEHCGFTCTAYKSADGTEVMLRIMLDRRDAQMMIAEHEQIRVPLRPDAYRKCNFEVPTDEFRRGRFLETGKPILESTPFAAKRESVVDSDFSEVNCIRMLRRHAARFVRADKLVASGVALQVFVAHRHAALARLHEAGWNDWRAILQWPGSRHVDSVREYFGEEVGFFFHWFNFFNRYLVVAGLAGGLVFAFEYTLVPYDDDGSPDLDVGDGNDLLVWPPGCYGRSYVRLVFSVFMCLWGSVYTKHYQQRSNFKIMEWGMKKYADAAQVRGAYVKAYRGTAKDRLQHLVHWLLVLAFIAETYIMVWLVCLLRGYLGEHMHEPTILGIKGYKARRLFPNLIITANIKLVDQLWKRLSPKLSEMENWRTDQQLKNSKVVKMFIVKFFVYYYPFWFIAFLQESFYGTSPDECMNDLRMQIYIYFPIEVACTIGATIFPLAKAWFLIKRSRGGAAGPLRHTEMQAKCPAYEDDIEDTMELILAFGFLMMFSTVVVLMPLLALVSNLAQIRLMAFRLSFADQRPPPRGQEGFGAWADIVQIITFAAVLCNAGLAVFVMRPLRYLPLQNRLAWLIVLEHALLIVKLFITAAVPSVSDRQRFIEEHNSLAVPAMLWRGTVRQSHGIAVDDGTAKVDLRQLDGDATPPRRQSVSDASDDSDDEYSSSGASSSAQGPVCCGQLCD